MTATEQPVSVRNGEPLDFWFDYSCPFAYLASTRIDAFAAHLRVPLRLRPMLLGGVFRAHGTAQNLMNVLSPAKARHNLADMHRLAAHYGVPLTIPSTHPMRTVEALRATLATGVDPVVVKGFFHAYWVDGRAVSEPDTLRAVLTDAGYDAEAVLQSAQGEAIRESLRVETDEAIALGIFGAPSMVHRGMMYWGVDRLPLLAHAAGTDWDRLPDTGATMPHTLEIYWDFSSPFAYLGSTQARALAERTGATLVWRPMLLGGLFKSIGQVDVPMSTWSDAKRNYYLQDMERWAAYWGVPFRFPSRFPMNTVKALRAWLALPEPRREAFLMATFRAYWAEDRDISDESVLRALIGEGADEVLARTQDPAIKQALIDATSRAVAVGAFGAPTWVVDEKDLFWGQDRIPLVERALRA